MKPILPTTPSHSTDRKTSRTNLSGLKPVEDISFPFPPFPLNSFVLSVLLSFFYSFFLPSFTFFIPSSCLLLFILLFYFLLKFLLILPLIFLYSFFLPSFPFLFPFSLLPFFPPAHFWLFPTGETTKHGVLKRPELDDVTPINVSSRPVRAKD